MSLVRGVQPPLTGDLTADQQRIVEFGDGPAAVIAGAGTGKTRVIVERVRHLLETREGLLPEQILVLTYNVKAAAELRQRIEATVGVALASRMAISNFHSFCQGVLTDHAADAGLPPRPDVLDGIGQFMLLRDIRPDLGLVYHSTDGFLGLIVSFITRCKDVLVITADFDAFVVEERRAFEERFGDAETAVVRLETQGNLTPLRNVRGAYAKVRANERAEARGETRDYDPAGA
jgi:superfamily I DNA/RNA helicase